MNQHRVKERDRAKEKERGEDGGALEFQTLSTVIKPLLECHSHKTIIIK